MSNIISNDLKKKKKKKQKISKKQKIIISVVGLVLVAGVVGGWCFWDNQQTKNSPVSEGEPQIIDKVADDWAISNSERDFDKGRASLEDRLDNSTTDARRAEVYAQMSSLALNNGHYDVAHEYAIQSDKLDPTEWSAHRVASTADRLGQRDLAIEYYRIAITRAETMISQNGDEYGSLSRFIGEMNRHINGEIL